jgi:putative phage-type endonuclease
MIKQILEIINMLSNNKKLFLTPIEYKTFKNDICTMYFTLYNTELESSIIDTLFINGYILNSFITESTITQKYLFKDNIYSNFITVEERDILYENLINKIKDNLLEENNNLIIKKIKHYDFLKTLPQPVQRSSEWYELRNNMITASTAADILNESKYGNRDNILLDKIGKLPDKYKENMFVHHGKKYELIATMIYEHLFNTKVGEFGLIPYQNDESDIENINYIGASPDGINTCITLDGKINNIVGRMLEIKCPLKRTIITKGNIDGEICPHNYWIQVQVQLACCKNDECDFWQCDITEIEEDEWLLYSNVDIYDFDGCICTIEQNEKIEINKRITRGCIIQLLPKNTSRIPNDDKIEWYAKYIYPSNLKMSEKEYIEWYKYIINNWKNMYPNYVNDYNYDKILYWKLKSCHNVLIKRDDEWFKLKIPLFKQFWNDVIKYRNNNNLGNKLLNNYLNKKKTNIFPKKQYITKNIIEDNIEDDFIIDNN